MDRLVRVGRTFFAVALIGLGTEHLVFGDFVTGRAPAWPESVPGGGVWAALTGAVVIVAGAMVLTGKRGRAASMVVAGLVFAWALVRHLPVVVAAPLLSGEWTRAGKALWIVGGALAVAATFPTVGTVRDTVFSRALNARGELIVLGRACLGLFLIVTGFQHYLFTDFVASLIPRWFPGDAVFWTYFAGVALVAGGIGLWIPRTARLAAFLVGLMVFSWFWIIHVPRTFLDVSSALAVFEALAVSGIALVLAGYREADAGDPASERPPARDRRLEHA